MVRYPHIESDLGICAGQPHISGTRITVAIIASEIEYLRMSADEVVATHPHLTLAQVHAVLAYFYDHRDEIERAPCGRPKISKLSCGTVIMTLTALLLLATCAFGQTKSNIAQTAGVQLSVLVFWKLHSHFSHAQLTP